MKEFLAKYTANIFTIATVIIIAWIIISNPFKCGKGAMTAANAKTDSALQVINDARVAFLKLQDTLTELRHDSTQQRINAEALAEETNTALTAQADAADNSKGWERKYNMARQQLDTVLALASCDTLVLAVAKERIKAAAAQKACSTQVTELGDVLVNRNKQIAVLNQQVAVLKQPANIVTDALHAAKSATKEPWIKGYIGAELDGGGTTIFAGGGPKLVLVTRNGFMMMGGAKLLTNGTTYQIGIAKLISFKKK
jgi:hypothetical protein